MPKLKKKIVSRRDYLNPYFGPSGSRPGLQVRLPNLPPTLDNTSLNIKTGNRPGSNPSNPNSRGSNAWSDFDKYGGRALLIGTGAHLAYKGGKYIQQRFITSQGRNFAPGQEPQIPARNVDPDPVQGEFLPDGEGTIEMANLGANRLVAPEGMQPFNVDSSNASNAVSEEGETVITQAANTGESFFGRIASSIGNWFKGAGETIEEELVPLLTKAAESGAADV
jgi:hypothetical protein